MNKRSLQQLLWLLFGVGLLTLLVIAGRNTSTQLVKKEAVQTQDAAPEKSESVSDADLSDI